MLEKFGNVTAAGTSVKTGSLNGPSDAPLTEHKSSFTSIPSEQLTSLYIEAMRNPFRSSVKYEPVSSSNSENEFKVEGSEKSGQLCSPLTGPSALTTLGVVLLALSFLGGMFIESYAKISPLIAIPNLSTERCKNPSTRREWRSLSTAEKESYIAAVQCLREKPSRLGLQYPLYDDFPWVHGTVGASANQAALFLSWHRYFIHIYEKTLKEECHYDGHLTYWDWSLDWEDISSAPVWDPIVGFGGNGHIGLEAGFGSEVGIGHCVLDGPFAGMPVPYLNSVESPHCLSRHFNITAVSDIPDDEWRLHLRPQSLEDLMSTQNYEELNLGLEDTAHNAIPNLVGGDFRFFSSPYEPTFYLHHTQLDRLWWLWQKEDPENRLYQYNGAASFNSSESASVEDLLLMDNFAPAIQVKNVLDSESGVLCYKY